MAQDLDSIAGVVQVFFAGKYDGKNRSAVGIEKPAITFQRPTLKSTSRQITLELLNGPVDIDIIIPGGDQQWRVVAFRRQDASISYNPDQGNTSEDYSGPADEVIRIK
jgi:hypothetical protein